MAALSVEPAYASLCMNELYMSLQNLRLLSSPLPYGRAPLLISRACLRTLKVQFTYWVPLSNK
jgi:hypothetical protein